jgi:hypothetical protein
MAFLVYSHISSGPRFRGKSVEQWLASFSREPNHEVINAFGLSACPELIRVMQKEKSKFAPLWVRLPSSLQKRFRHLNPSKLPLKQSFAARWLNALGTDAEAFVPHLSGIVSNKPQFASTLAFIGKNRPETSRILASLLQHTNITVQDEVALTPGVLRSNALPLLPGLTNLIANHRQQPPFNAILGVGLIGPSASNAVPLLAACLAQSNLVANSLTALENIGPGALAAVPILCELLDKSPPDKRLQIVKCLYAIGSNAFDAVPHLRQVQSAETNLTQLLVSLALAQIENNRGNAAAALARSLAGRTIRSDERFMIVLPDSETTSGSYFGLTHAEYAALLAADFGDRPELLPHLKNALHSSDKWLRVLAARAVSRHRGTSEILPVITEALGSDALPLYVAVQALKDLPLSKQELGPLIEFVENMKRSWRHRIEVLNVIKRVDPNFELKP